MASNGEQPRAGRDLDAMVAERVMELPGVEWVGAQPKYRNERMAADYGGRWTSPVPEYSVSIEAAMQVEDRIAALGKQNDYIAHLWDEVGAARDGANFWTAQNFNAFWLCVHATAVQRCRAALAALAEKES